MIDWPPLLLVVSRERGSYGTKTKRMDHLNVDSEVGLGEGRLIKHNFSRFALMLHKRPQSVDLLAFLFIFSFTS